MSGANPNVPIMSPKRALLYEIDQENRRMGFANAIQLPGYLRSEVVLSTTNRIEFAIGVNEQAEGQAIAPTENRLRINDAFFVTHWSVMFYTFVTASGLPARSRARLHTFDNSAIFGLNAPSLRAAYNGKLSLRVNDRVYVDSMDAMRFYQVGTAQQGVEVSTGAAQPAYVADNFTNSEAFALETDPLVRLDGAGSNRLALTLPDSVNFGLVAGSSVVAVAYLRGWLSQNGGSMRTPNQR